MVITNLRFHAGNSGNHLAKDATSLIPIVFTLVVGTGVVANLARPGGNATGLMAALVEGRNVSYWHKCDLSRCPLCRRSWSISGRNSDIGETTRMTDAVEKVLRKRTVELELETIECRRANFLNQDCAFAFDLESMLLATHRKIPFSTASPESRQIADFAVCPLCANSGLMHKRRARL